MEDTLRETVARLNAQMEGMPYHLAVVDPKELKLLEKNAHYMAESMFRNLVQNIQRDGGLASVPLCCREKDGKLLVLSGNHRVQAAVHAGLEKILVLVAVKELSRQEKVAIQLSHNALVGKDDAVLLKELWSEIEALDLKCYAGLDTELIAELDKIEFVSIAEARVDHKQVSFLFLPEEVDELKKLMEDADLLFMAEESYLLSCKHYETVFALLADVKEKYSIVNNPTALMKIIELARERLEEINIHASEEEAKSTKSTT